MSTIKFRGAQYREVVAVQMGKLVDSTELNAALQALKQQTKEFETAYKPAVQRYNNLKRFIGQAVPNGDARLTKLEGAAFQPYITENLKVWSGRYEDRVKLLKKINTAAGEGLVKYDELEAKLVAIDESIKSEISNFGGLVAAAKKTLQILDKYSTLIYDLEESAGEEQHRIYYNFVKQFPGTNVLAPVAKFVEQYEKLNKTLQTLANLFESAKQSLLAKASKVGKKQSKEKQSAEPSVVIDENLVPAIAKAQEELKWALELNFDGAKKEFSVLVKFLQQLYPTSATKLGRLGNVAFDAEVLEALSAKSEFSDADVSTFKKIYNYFSSIVENLETISELVLEKFKTPTGDAEKDEQRNKARKLLRSMNARNGIENDPLGSNLSNLKEMLDRLDGAALAIA